jgi:NhaP-type Na+/H+ or K+/H+ antiporter
MSRFPFVELSETNASRPSPFLGLALCLAILFTTRPASAVPSISVADAVAFCEAGFAPPQGQAASASRRNACVAYIDGVIGAVAQIAAIAETGKPSRSAALFCIPGNEPYERLSDVYIRFARANPQHSERAAASIFVAAFAAAYPCNR